MFSLPLDPTRPLPTGQALSMADRRSDPKPDPEQEQEPMPVSEPDQAPDRASVDQVSDQAADPAATAPVAEASPAAAPATPDDPAPAAADQGAASGPVAPPHPALERAATQGAVAGPQTVFEHPLNERVRTFLRLEHLLEKVEHFAGQASPWGTRAALEALLDVIAITARADIKTELIKEIDRNLATLARLSNQRGVDPAALQQISVQLEEAAAGIHALPGPIGAEARDDSFLKAVAQRSSIPGGACSFDLPFYHHFLMQPESHRRARLDHWQAGLAPFVAAIRLVLSLARASARPRQLVANGGFFQEALNPQAPAQLVRIGLSAELAVFPEVSGHKNRFSIRFLQPNGSGRPAQSPADIAFALTCCVF